MPVQPHRSYRRDDHADQLIGQSRDTILPTKTPGLGCRDVTTSGLAVHTRPLCRPPEPSPLQPTAEHLTHLNHTDLPETH